MTQGLTLSLTRYRHVLVNFIRGDLKAKYRGSIAGYLWTLLEPMSLVLTYYFLFTVIAHVDRPAYPVVLLAGVLPWNFFSAVVSAGSTSLLANSGLIQKIYLPREIFLLSQVGSNTVVFLLSLLAIGPFLLAYGLRPSPWALALVPLGTLLLVAVSMGLGLVFACMNVVYRDVGYVLRVALRLGLYASPVVYTLEMVPVRFRDLYLLNPVSVAISMLRTGLLGEASPLGTAHVLIALVTSTAVLIGGLLVFRAWEPKVIKYL